MCLVKHEWEMRDRGCRCKHCHTRLRPGNRSDICHKASEAEELKKKEGKHG